MTWDQIRRRTIRTDECPDGLFWIRGRGERRIVLYPRKSQWSPNKESPDYAAPSKQAKGT